MTVIILQLYSNMCNQNKLLSSKNINSIFDIHLQLYTKAYMASIWVALITLTQIWYDISELQKYIYTHLLDRKLITATTEMVYVVHVS